MNNSLDDAFWYVSKDPHEGITANINHLETNQAYRQTENLHHARLYGNASIPGFELDQYARSKGQSRNRISLNIVQSMVDTVTAMIAQNKPAPKILTSQGLFSHQRRARLLQKFIKGQFYATGIYRKGERVFKDGCIFGTGAIKIYEEHGEIVVERVFPNELTVDDEESFYGEPRTMYQTKFIAKEVLKAMFPEKAAHIEMAKSSRKRGASNLMTQQLKVTEAWHLPSGPDATDGRHVICIEGATLFDEPWTKSYFPFVIFRWNDRVAGFYGQGLAEQLTDLQLEINYILSHIQRSMRLLGAPMMLVDKASKIIKDHLNNAIGNVITYQGKPPVVQAFQSVNPEWFQHLAWCYEKSYQIAGIGTQSAHAQREPGLRSGRAIRMLNDIESGRQVMVAKAYERFYMDAAEQMIDLAKDIAARDGDYGVMYPGKRNMQKINWSQVDMQKDQYLMQIFPTNFLPNTPAGKLEAVQELLQAGFIAKEDGLALLDAPDLDRVQQLERATADVAERTIEKLLEGEWVQPEPFDHLQYIIRKAQLAYDDARNDNAEPEVLDLVRDYITEAQDLLNPPAPPTGAGMGPGPAQDGLPPVGLPGQVPNAGDPQLAPGTPGGTPVQPSDQLIPPAV